MFNFKEIIVKVLSGELSGYFKVNGGYKITLRSDEFRQEGNYYVHEHIIKGKKSRKRRLTYCAAGNCLEDIGEEEESLRHFWDIIEFIPEK